MQTLLDVYIFFLPVYLIIVSSSSPFQGNSLCTRRARSIFDVINVSFIFSDFYQKIKYTFCSSVRALEHEFYWRGVYSVHLTTQFWIWPTMNHFIVLFTRQLNGTYTWLFIHVFLSLEQQLTWPFCLWSSASLTCATSPIFIFVI